MFAAIVGDDDRARECFAYLAAMRVPVKLFKYESEGGKSLSASDKGGHFLLHWLENGSAHSCRARYLVLAPMVQDVTGGLQPNASLFIGCHDKKFADGNFFRGKCVAVLGGGEGAISCYQQLKIQGAHAVKVFAREVTVSAQLAALVSRDDLNECGVDIQFSESKKLYAISCHDDPFTRDIFEYVVVNYGRRVVDGLTALWSHHDSEEILDNEVSGLTSRRIFTFGHSASSALQLGGRAQSQGLSVATALKNLFHTASNS